MPNHQEPERQITSFPGFYEIHSMFNSIQGEGPYQGHPATFIRFAGCNLQCPGCDTNYTDGRSQISLEKLKQAIDKLTPLPERGLAVITGGEPFRQDLYPLVSHLIYRNFEVQIETNGTLDISSVSHLASCRIVVSPKTPRIHPSVHRYVHAWKYVLQDGNIDWNDGLPIYALGLNMKQHVARPETERGDIYIQPMDEQDEEKNYHNLQACVKSCKEFGHILQLQIHKLIGVP
jgi:organic radical activating enzyme